VLQLKLQNRRLNADIVINIADVKNKILYCRNKEKVKRDRRVEAHRVVRDRGSHIF
jgi:ribonuclease HI